MLRALLVDDSVGSLETLRSLLENFCPQVEIVGEAENPDKAYELMLKLRPNLILLDVEMPLGTGFDLVEQSKDLEFEVIFITAHEQYALEAIKHEALDYLLKPVSHIDLMKAIKKAETRIEGKNIVDGKKAQLTEANPKKNKLAIPTQKGIEFLPVDKILYFEADGAYTYIHTLEKKILTTLRLGKWEEKLTKSFFRIHRSYVINLNEIKEYIRGVGGFVIMTNGAKLPITRNRRDAFLQISDEHSL